MKLTMTATIKDIEAIDILHDSYADAVIKIVYWFARDLQFLWNWYEAYREKVKHYWDVISDKWFDILWNLAISYNRENYPCHMSDYADIQERELAEKDLEDDFILLWIDEWENS